MSLTINILHILPNRFRIKLSKAPKDIEKFKFQVMDHEGIESLDFSPVTQTALIQFDPGIIKLQEILIRTAVAFSVEHEFKPVVLNQRKEVEFITPKGIVAGLVILGSASVQMLSQNPVTQRTINWLSAITTGAAVLEHAAFDYRKKGSVDPEVLSLFYLGNAFLTKKNLLFPAALTWITTFGRHFSSTEGEGVLLQVNPSKKQGKKSFYEVNVSKLNNKGSFVDILNLFAENFLSSVSGFNNTFFENSKELTKTHDEVLEGIGDRVNGIVLKFNQ